MSKNKLSEILASAKAGIMPLQFQGNKDIVIYLDDMYLGDEEQWRIAIIEHLKKEGRDCKYLGENKILVDGNKYLMNKLVINSGIVPIQRTYLSYIE